MTVEGERSPRCAFHPGRLAADACPACGRARCGADAAAFGERACAVCHSAGTTVRVARDRREVALRALLAGLAAAFPAAWVAAEYVNVHLMALVAPFLLGLASAAAASAGARPATAVERRVALAAGGLAALAGTALSFRLFGPPMHFWRPLADVGPPYLATLAGALAWPVLFAAPARPGQPAGSIRKK